MNTNKLPQSYGTFEATIESVLNGELKPRYLGGGNESSVYELIIDENRYAAKFAQKWTRFSERPRNTAAATQRKIDAGLRGLGVAGLEQIVSASPESGVAIYDLVEGKTVDSMTREELGAVPEGDMSAFFASVDRAVDLGIEFDPWNQDGTNVIYSPDAGFTLIDYFVDYAKTSKEESRLNGYRALGAKSLELAGVFGTELYDFQLSWSRPEDFVERRWRR